jgi:hypothetical protein
MVVSDGPSDAQLQRVDSANKPICSTCPTRLTRCKGNLYGPSNNKQCMKCYMRQERGQQLVTCEERPAKKQRRTKSDPGQPEPIASTRLRIRAPKPPPPTTKPRLVNSSINPVDPMALLEAAHARRVALLEEEKNGIGSSTPNASSVVWQ